MGNNDSIIYGSRHGHSYRSRSGDAELGDVDLREIDKKNGIEEKTYYPNAVKVTSYGESYPEVNIGIVTFDQETGEQLDSFEKTNALFANLDRAGLNRLIADLKRHGKKVFGSDEW